MTSNKVKYLLEEKDYVWSKLETLVHPSGHSYKNHGEGVILSSYMKVGLKTPSNLSLCGVRPKYLPEIHILILLVPDPESYSGS